MAGLALGAKLFLPGTAVHGMMVDTNPFDEITPALMRETAALLEISPEITPQDYPLRDMCGPGYAIASEAGNAAVSLVAAREGIFLDPVYTGKAFAGLLELAKEGAFARLQAVCLFFTRVITMIRLPNRKSRKNAASRAPGKSKYSGIRLNVR